MKIDDYCEINETCPICPHKETCVLQPYTREQINDYCEKVLNLHLTSRPEGKLLFESVQIIRQLQAPVLLNPEVAIGVEIE